MSQKYFWADRLQRLSWWFSMISAPKEHNKSIKASHTIKWCGWLFSSVWILFPLLLRLFYSENSVLRTVQRTAPHITLTSRTTNTTVRSLTPLMDWTHTITVHVNTVHYSVVGTEWTHYVRNTTPSVRMLIAEIIQ